ncbi:DUF6572 domain-containing protein [uncultured Oxalicibacterium sp.]|uniref:DUF6572 domain-containing protein n=1 Tax=uncultured Oxalicibacterium sp. TaxID=1168540 RepID=UPI0025ED8BBE|nr:DUF6572 domain-containing protein [uncultured Oxalicibacterium sp.]
MHQPFDSISLDATSDACILTLLICEEWNDTQLFATQERINACLQWIESGELYLAHPGARGRECVIDLRSIYQPDQATFRFLEQAQTVLEDAGYGLRHGPLGSAYVEVDTR